MNYWLQWYLLLINCSVIVLSIYCDFYEGDGRHVIKVTGPPGWIGFIGKGLDISKFDFFSVHSTSDEFSIELSGLREQLIDLTCHGTESWENIYWTDEFGIKHYIPDQVSEILLSPEDTLTYENMTFLSEDEYRIFLADLLHLIPHHMPENEFRSSVIYKAIRKSRLNGDIFNFRISSKRTQYKVVLKRPLSMGDNALNHFNSLPSELNEKSYIEYERFLKIYGTHYLRKITFGSLVMHLNTKMDYYNVSFPEIWTPGFMLQVEKISDMRQRLNFIFGCKVNGCKTNWSTMFKRVPLTFWPTGGELNPISDLLSDQIKKDILRKAISAYLNRETLQDSKEYLQEIEANLNSEWIFNKSFSKSRLRLNELWSELAQLAQLDQIDQIDFPSSERINLFSKQIQDLADTIIMLRKSLSSDSSRIDSKIQTCVVCVIYFLFIYFKI